jgi:hypothetical protein
MRIKVDIEGTEVTVDTQAGQEKPSAELGPSGAALPPELAAVVAAGEAMDGGRAPTSPLGTSPLVGSMESSAVEDRPGGAAPADANDRTMMQRRS